MLDLYGWRTVFGVSEYSHFGFFHFMYIRTTRPASEIVGLNHTFVLWCNSTCIAYYVAVCLHYVH